MLLGDFFLRWLLGLSAAGPEACLLVRALCENRAEQGFPHTAQGLCSLQKSSTWGLTRKPGLACVLLSFPIMCTRPHAGDGTQGLAQTRQAHFTELPSQPCFCSFLSRANPGFLVT